MKPCAGLVAVCLVLASAFPALAQAGGVTATFPAPRRPIAPIVSPDFGDEAQRDRTGEAEQLARTLDVRPGMAVADIGAGSGYHTLRMARRVGPTGRVYAEDVTPAYLADLRRSLAAAWIGNVQIVLGQPDDPRLAPKSLDLAIMVHMYHEVSQPFGLLYNLAPALRPGAKVAVIDMDRPTWNHGTPPSLLRCEFEAVGYRLESYEALTSGLGYLMVFLPPAPGDRPAPSAIRTCQPPPD